ncbi:MAG: transposase, partial [Tepidisphaeraceae bacterium]
MITRRDHSTGDLFDRWHHLGARRRAILDLSWAGEFRRSVLPHLALPELALVFCRNNGRPGKDMIVAVGVLVLQQMHDLTDAATLEALAFNEQWHFALDARVEDDFNLCDKTLRNWRNKMMAHGLDRVLFARVTDLLAARHGTDASRQRLDSTRVCSNMAKLGRLGLFARTIEMFLRRLRKDHPNLLASVNAAIVDRHLGESGPKGEKTGGGGGCFALSSRPSEAKRRLEESAADLLRLVRQFAQTPAATALKEYQLLARLLAEQCEIVPRQRDKDAEDGGGGSGGGDDDSERVVVRDAKGLAGDVLQNPSDPDATYNGHKGQGYCAQIMETYDPGSSGPGLITHVSVGKMSDHDGRALAPALADAATRGLLPGEVTADTHYGAQENLDDAAALGVTLIAPAQPPAGYKEGKLSLEQF